MLLKIAKFLVPYNTRRRTVAKKGEGNIRYVAAMSGTRFHACLAALHPANQGASTGKPRKINSPA